MEELGRRLHRVPPPPRVLWSGRPDDRIELQVSRDGTDGSALEFVWLAAQPLPGHASPFRYRLHELFAEHLRTSYGQ